MRSALALLLAAGCVGKIGEPGTSPGGDNGPGPGANDGPETLGLGSSSISRLSREEYAATVKALLGVDLGADIELLPADSFTPFDNDYTLQVPSRTLVEGLKAVAERATAKLVADATGLRAVVGCTPAGPGDAKCLRDFVTRFGRRTLRRPLAEAEITGYLGFGAAAVAANDFNVAASMVIRAMLQDLEFVYRIEIGTPVSGRPDVFRLDDWEMASRLAFFLTGRAPDDALLDAAADGDLEDTKGIRAAADRLLGDAAGIDRLERFHALWLGYERMPHAAALADAMRRETDALIRRVVIEERRPWTDLFTSTETYVDGMLASIYGLDTPAGGQGWMPYADAGRRGILSHGAVLANGAKNGDTSPTLRGKFVRERLMCQPMPPPPPEVQADQPPKDTAGRNCKSDRYAAHRVAGSTCAGCHTIMDGIGFGLENYDATGRYRATDTGKPDCAIDGVGELQGVGTFKGPGELGALLVQSGALTSCLSEQLFHFAVGRSALEADRPIVEALGQALATRQLDLRTFILDWVSDAGFRLRTVEKP